MTNYYTPSNSQFFSFPQYVPKRNRVKIFLQNSSCLTAGVWKKKKKNAHVRNNKVGTNDGPIEFSRGNTSSGPIRRTMAAAVFPTTTWKPPYAFPYLLFFFIRTGIFSFSTLPTSYASNHQPIASSLSSFLPSALAVVPSSYPL